MPLASRRSSDPSLNEKWQEHRRSLELSSLAGPGEEPSDPDSLGKPTKVLGGAELSVAAGVAEGQMENILQEATKEESGIEEPAQRGSTEMQEVKKEALLEKGKTPEGSAIVLPQEPELGDAPLANHPGTNLSGFSQGIPEQQGGHSVLPGSLQESPRGEDAQEVPVEQFRIAITEEREEAFLPIPVDTKVGYDTSQSSSLLPSQVPVEARGPSTDSSVDMLIEDQVKSESGPKGHHRPCLVNSGWFSGKDMLPQATEPQPSEKSLAERPQVGSVVHRTSPGSTHSPTHSPCALPLAECKEGLVCNGAPETENKALEQSPGLSTLQKHPTPNGHCTNGEAGRSKDSLSRQLSATSCNSAHLHSRNLHHKWLHSHSGRPSTTGSPDQPSRSHLDDDGMPVYTDTIQQRLRQIESGHQQEVETLKKQVQELRSRLESQYLTSSLRFNGDFGDEVVSRPRCLDSCPRRGHTEAGRFLCPVHSDWHRFLKELLRSRVVLLRGWRSASAM